jgi:hypothetical protein
MALWRTLNEIAVIAMFSEIRRQAARSAQRRPGGYLLQVGLSRRLDCSLPVRATMAWRIGVRTHGVVALIRDRRAESTPPYARWPRRAEDPSRTVRRSLRRVRSRPPQVKSADGRFKRVLDMLLAARGDDADHEISPRRTRRLARHLRGRGVQLDPAPHTAREADVSVTPSRLGHTAISAEESTWGWTCCRESLFHRPARVQQLGQRADVRERLDRVQRGPRLVGFRRRENSSRA